MNRKLSRIYLVIFFIAFIFSIAFYFGSIYDYLNLDHPVEPGILIVEGWLSNDHLKKAKEEFEQKGYSLIITTGMPYQNGFQMGSFGNLVLDINNSIIPSYDSVYEISILVRGTKAADEFAHFRLLADSVVIGENYTTRHKKEFSYTTKLRQSPMHILIDFDNDTFTRYRDRNLYVYSFNINGQLYKINNENIRYYNYNLGELKQTLSSSLAMDAASFFKEEGVADSLIIAVESLQKIKSKTYTSAMDVKSWLEVNYINKDYTITVFTEGIHARRSWISFRKVFGKNIPIGVISCQNNETNRSNWWKTNKTRRQVFYETAGIIYAGIFL